MIDLSITTLKKCSRVFNKRLFITCQHCHQTDNYSLNNLKDAQYIVVRNGSQEVVLCLKCLRTLMHDNENDYFKLIDYLRRNGYYNKQ